MENQPGLKNFDQNIIFIHNIHEYIVRLLCLWLKCYTDFNPVFLSKESRIKTGYIHELFLKHRNV